MPRANRRLQPSREEERDAIDRVNEVEVNNLSTDPDYYEDQLTDPAVVDQSEKSCSPPPPGGLSAAGRCGAGIPANSPLTAQIAALPRRHDNDYPLWQGPCGDGPNGGITQSMLVRFLSCRERFRLKYVLGLEPPDRWNHRLGYGNMWHACEEVFARGDHTIPALVRHAEEQVAKYPYQRNEISKWAKVCQVQFPEYVRYWSEHPDVQNRTPLMQEQVFDVPYALPSGRVVRLRGKFDSVDYINGECDCGADRTGPSAEAHDVTCPRSTGCKTGIYLQENKTRGDVDKLQIERQLKFDLQTMLYLIALKEHNATHGYPLWMLGKPTEIRGVRYNVVRRPLSGGVGNIKPRSAQYTKTKTVPAETEAEFYERLRRDYLADDPGYWFFRVRAEVSSREVQLFRDTCLDPLLEHLCFWYEQVTYIDHHRSDLGEVKYPTMNYRTPFGVWSALEEGGATEYDAYLESGSEVGLLRTETLFTELK